ncbi:MAG: hypothetical protein O3C43_05895 [Verrucomicrobia bacterium]|nr:hypothetical protein [Verrucomicrobiota bacterium]MDA1066017.1 hypothetical protein [Verrucomicrobiota bacterium]
MEHGVSPKAKEAETRFIELTLYTSQPDALFSCYANDLGMKVTEGKDQYFAVELGESVLIWEPAENGTCPIYHYAINIALAPIFPAES